ncbi:RPM1-interacting protein 4-like [Lotus japonicus]|uniref:RPM1-interacting protein 4-like n=1 Tax=Lotus japonicus TaxID=34305 RepID=UPI0025834C5C|nr:RPM1-interacting protein 4-like [Lotus japonicus]
MDNMTHSHVPKFGNWDTDNIPYTIYFENASKEKTNINPNDPEFFNLFMRGAENNDDDDDAMKARPSGHGHSYSTNSSEIISTEEERRSNTKLHSESANEKSDSDYSVIQRVKSGHRKSMSVGGSHSSNNHSEHNHEATLIPEFGAWDVTDPKSGGGYTEIFSEVRKERQMASHLSKAPSLNNCSNVKNQCGRPSSIYSKYCCCLFSSEGE